MFSTVKPGFSLFIIQTFKGCTKQSSETGIRFPPPEKIQGRESFNLPCSSVLARQRGLPADMVNLCHYITGLNIIP